MPISSDELTALFLLKNISELIDGDELQGKINSLWGRCRNQHKKLSEDLNQLSSYFSSDSTAIADMADNHVLDLVEYARTGAHLEILYKSPWRHSEPRTYIGKILHVRYSDGTIYLYVHESSGRGIILNPSFIQTIKETSASLVPLKQSAQMEHSNWFEGFGIWANEELFDVEISILPPAAEYYRTQRWHDDQEDSFSDGILIRRFKTALSPELVRRILSLGIYLKDVSPKELKEKVGVQVRAMIERLGS